MQLLVDQTTSHDTLGSTWPQSAVSKLTEPQEAAAHILDLLSEYLSATALVVRASNAPCCFLSNYGLLRRPVWHS